MAKLYNKNGRILFKGNLKLARAIERMFKAHKIKTRMELEIFDQEVNKTKTGA